MNWRLTLYYTSLPSLTGSPSMPFDKIDTLNDYSFILGVSKSDLTFLAPILTSDNQHGIVLSNLHSP